MNVLLYAPLYRPNLSSMIRTAEFFGLQKLFIYDTNKLMLPPTSKNARAEMEHMARVWTAGAIAHIEIVPINDAPAFIRQYTGRTVGTVIQKKAHPLETFSFRSDDLLIMGSEKEGLPSDVIHLMDESIYLPSSGHTPCLNVAVCFGICMHYAQTSFRN